MPMPVPYDSEGRRLEQGAAGGTKLDLSPGAVIRLGDGQ